MERQGGANVNHLLSGSLLRRWLWKGASQCETHTRTHKHRWGPGGCVIRRLFVVWGRDGTDLWGRRAVRMKTGLGLGKAFLFFTGLLCRSVRACWHVLFCWW